MDFLRISIVCTVLLARASALTYPVVDTGVTESFSDRLQISMPRPGQPFYGQDSNYAGHAPSYRNNNDGTITDLVTGLMWQRTMGPKMSWANAQRAIRNFSLAGYKDWRIPTIKELYSLMLFTGDVQAATAGSKRFIDTNYFVQPVGNTSNPGERQIDAQTLSGTKYFGFVFENTECNFGVNFIDGRIKCYPSGSGNRRDRWYFRFVRGNPSYGINSFTDNGDGTVTDSATSLMWQKSDSGNGMIWQDALAYCENLTLAGYSDWRLPNPKELQSIVDYTRGPYYNDTAAIDPIFSISEVTFNGFQYQDWPYFWTGTTLKDMGPPPRPGQLAMPSQAVYIIFGTGFGNPFGRVIDVHGAGAQRSDPKTGSRQSYPQFFGPQGDMQMVYNYARCVRTADVSDDD